MKKTSKSSITCSFCSSRQKDVKLLVEGNLSYICNNCIENAYETLIENETQTKSERKRDQKDNDEKHR